MDSKAIKIGYLAICLVAAVLTTMTISSVLAGSAAEEKIIEQKDIKTIRPTLDEKNGSTYYEEVKEIGFYPQERRLEAVIAIKKPSPYNAYEYVGFWVDWNNNGIFSPEENVGIVNVYVPDPGYSSLLPLSYAVYSDITPPPLVKTGAVVKVKAILSYSTPPTGPDYMPVWGNSITRNIRIDPIR